MAPRAGFVLRGLVQAHFERLKKSSASIRSYHGCLPRRISLAHSILAAISPRPSLKLKNILGIHRGVPNGCAYLFDSTSKNPFFSLTLTNDDLLLTPNNTPIYDSR